MFDFMVDSCIFRHCRDNPLSPDRGDYLEAPNVCFGRRFYKQRRSPRLFFESNARFGAKNVRIVAKTCAL